MKLDGNFPWWHFLKMTVATSVGSIQDLRTGASLVRTWPLPIFFPRIHDSHSDRIHSSLCTVHCFDKGYVGKQSVAWKEHCVEYWLKEIHERMDRCTGRPDITGIVENDIKTTDTKKLRYSRTDTVYKRDTIVPSGQ